MNTESKRVVVNPNGEVNAIDSLKCFGWKLISRNEVMNSQEVFDSAYSYSNGSIGGTTVNTHTEVHHFVSLLFERDLDLPNLAEIRTFEVDCDLQLTNLMAEKTKQESKAEENASQIDYWEKARAHSKKGGGLIALGLFLLFLYFLISGLVSRSFPYIWAILLWFLILGIVSLIVGIKRQVNPLTNDYFDAKEKPYKEAIEALNAQLKVYQDKAKEDMMNAQKLLIDKPNEEVAQSSSSPSDNASAKERLSRLQELHSQGLISEDEFAKKREEILKNL
jgi:hypothetical protein